MGPSGIRGPASKKKPQKLSMTDFFGGDFGGYLATGNDIARSSVFLYRLAHADAHRHIET